MRDITSSALWDPMNKEESNAHAPGGHAVMELETQGSSSRAMVPMANSSSGRRRLVVAWTGFPCVVPS